MPIKTLYRWEQDGAGGEHGTATYFPDEEHEVTVTLPSFKYAHELARAVEEDRRLARLESRQALLAEIARIKP